jgi:ABC-2 type transport system permease protein
MNNLPLLLKREYWEHRGGFLWTPIWITVAILIITVLGMITAEIAGSNVHVHVGFSLSELRNNISANDLAEAGRGLDVAQLVFGGAACVGLFFVSFFYLLGALYDDRRDRSVLFWKSLPVSDLATVVSKALSAMLVIPVLTLGVATLAYFAFLIMICMWAGLHGLNALPAVMAAHPLGMFMRLVAALPVGALWALPTVGWLLFWSAYVRSKPFLWAVLLPALALFANWWVGVLGGPHISGDLHLASILGRLLFSVAPGSWMGAAGMGGPKGWLNPHGDQVTDLFAPNNVYALMTTPDMWIGVVAGLALLAGAVWLRGRRIEVNV